MEGTEGWFVPTERIKTFDEEFLEYMEAKRLELARDLVRQNPKYEWGETNLNEIVQRLLNRILFIRICEDRDIDTGQTLERLLEGWESGGRAGSLYSVLLEHFRWLEKPFNGTLFRAGDASESVTVSDKFLSGLIRELSSEDSDYVFSTIPIEILGSVYERFIGSVVKVSGTRVSIEPKAEVRKAGGVYYTPRYVVAFIVEATVGRLLRGLSQKEVEKVTVLDPACGSGSFLIRSFERICEHYLSLYGKRRQIPRTAAYRDSAGNLQLTTHFKKSAMLKHIYGVDLDQQAVEVTMLSLYLKILEGENRSTLAQQRMLFPKESFLPDLSGNICLGNSLIESDFFELFADEEDHARIRPFDWKVQFRQIIESGGFDAIVGNPPYYNVDKLGKKSEEMRYLMTRYSEVWNDKTDILNYFLYRGINLSRSHVGMIVSRAFLEAYKSDRLRRAILKHTSISQVVDFGDFHVFKDAGITTAIIILHKRSTSHTIICQKLKNGNVEAELVAKALISGKRGQIFEEFKTNQNHLTSDSWNLAPESMRDLYDLIDDDHPRLDHFLIGGQGMQTAANAVFCMPTSQLRKLTTSPSRSRRRARNSDIQRWEIIDSGKSLLWVEDYEDFDDLPSAIRDYLRRNASVLRKRAACKRGNCEWWKFTWPLHKELYSEAKIVSPFLSNANRFALDSDRSVIGLTDTIVLFKREGTEEDLRYFLGLLNSNLLTFRFRGIAKLKGAGIYEYFANSVSKLPIRKIDFENSEDRRMHDRIVHLASRLCSLVPRVRNAHSESKRLMMRRGVVALEQDLDTLVYKLYGLGAGEVKAVESSLSGAAQI